MGPIGYNSDQSMIVLPYLSIIQASGPDAGSFLHAQLSADVASLGDGEAGFACYCNPQGQVLALLLLGRRGNDFQIVCASSLAESVVKRLGMFVLRARVQLILTSGRHVVGLNPGDALAPGSMLLPPREVALQYGLIADGGEQEHGSESWQAGELIRGIAWLQPATSGRFLPQMLGLDRFGAVSFSKGCYPGQEIIARARYLGTVKRLPLRLRIEGKADLGAGDACVLHSSGRTIEAVVVESVSTAPDETTVFAVAPLAVGEPVDLLASGATSWTARRLDAGVGA